LGGVVGDEDIAALRRSSLFSPLKPEELSAVAETAKIQDYNANQIIVNEGEYATTFFLILSGLVEVRQAGSPRARLGRGNYFGETTLMGDLTRSCGVVALRRTRCMLLSGSELRSYPSVALKLLGESTLRDREAADEAAAAPSAEAPLPGVRGTIEFESDKARLVFNILVKSFTKDYMASRLILEQAGWMTFSELAKSTGVPRATLYGEHGNYGAMMNELLRRGLVETRSFTGQRGRGGEVLRIRIAYDKEPVKRYVDNTVLKRKSDKPFL
jgi:CRP-like cAMP-binding protein